jgi:hypothetical protein
MSELIYKTNREQFHWQLLSTVSALVLCAQIGTSAAARADDADKPTLWIELGGQLEHIDGAGDRFTPPFMLVTPTPAPYQKASPIDGQRPSRYSFGGEGSLTFNPEGSDWVFSASVRYGRSISKRHTHQQTNLGTSIYDRLYAYYPGVDRYLSKNSDNFADTKSRRSSSHLVLDFQVGKDVGLGMFGRGSSSVLSAGVRYAQFTSQAEVTAHARPDVGITFFTVFGLVTVPDLRFNTYSFHGSAHRDFQGVGPSLSWNASVPVVGNQQHGEISLDWGINGALLFGRQKSRTSHQTTSRHYEGYKYQRTIPGYPYRITHFTTRYQHTPPDQARSRSVTVPNLGLAAGLSYRVENFKASFGYRADFFFGAVDAGIDTRRSEALVFHGPYAKIGLGL